VGNARYANQSDVSGGIMFRFQGVILNVIKMPAERLAVIQRSRWRFACLAALALLATPGRAQEPLVFGAIGDSGEVSQGLLGVAREMQTYHRDRAKFDFVLMLGDNIYSDGIGRGLPRVFEAPFADLLRAGVQFYAVLGNHDIRRGTELQIHYPAWNMNGRRFYAFSKGDGLIEFFGLDSTALSEEPSSLEVAETARLEKERAALERKKTLTDSERKRLAWISAEVVENTAFVNEQTNVESAQLAWLGDALAASRARWRVVFLHHSIYSAATKRGGHGGEASLLRLRARLEPIFVRHGVDLVLAGHDHHYDRSTPQPAASPTGHKVQYVTAGASARLRANVVDYTNAFLARADATTHSFLIVRVTRDAVRIEARGADGRTLDTFEVVKTQTTER
jgi:3',5'-cyclic AMP phosphodiesterase CpdA